jgi:hypothetical protein
LSALMQQEKDKRQFVRHTAKYWVHPGTWRRVLSKIQQATGNLTPYFCFLKRQRWCCQVANFETLACVNCGFQGWDLSWRT